MRRFAGLLGTVLLLSCNNATYGGGGGGGGCTPTATKVCMVGKSFSPTNLTISTGTAVSWDNGSTLTHTVTSSSSSTRSEEHTSELQSHSDLVCRLLLE